MAKGRPRKDSVAEAVAGDVGQGARNDSRERPRKTAEGLEARRPFAVVFEQLVVGPGAKDQRGDDGRGQQRRAGREHDGQSHGQSQDDGDGNGHRQGGRRQAAQIVGQRAGWALFRSANAAGALAERAGIAGCAGWSRRLVALLAFARGLRLRLAAIALPRRRVLVRVRAQPWPWRLCAPGSVWLAGGLPPQSATSS